MAETEVDYSLANPDTLTKYKIANDISTAVLAKVKDLVKPDANILEICKQGDDYITEELGKVYRSKKNILKGIAFPTAISVNSIVSHFSPLPSEPESKDVIHENDVVKICLGAHIDGFASIVADTIVLSKEIEGKVADVISAAWYASEAAIRTIKPGNKNWDVTKVVDQIAKSYGTSPVEGMLSFQESRNVVDGKKQIILNPSESQKAGFETFTFEEGEVYGVDILISAGDGKTRSRSTKTTIYKKSDLTYILKLKASRAVYSEIQKNYGAFPFTIRTLNDEKKGKMGIQECTQHGLLIPYEVLEDKNDDIVAEYFTTIAVTKNGIIKLSQPTPPDFTKVKSDKKITDQDILNLLATSLKAPKKKNKNKVSSEEKSQVKQ